MIPDAALSDLRRRNPVTSVAGKWVSLRPSSSPKWQMVGPCPLCSTDPAKRKATKFECSAERWICAGCQKSGDVIELVMAREGKSFLDAVEWLGGAQQVDPAEEERRAREAGEKQRLEEAQAASFRERERERCWRYWKAGGPIAGTAVEAYLHQRGLIVPPGARLRHHGAFKFYLCQTEGRRQVWHEIHRGPAMLAAIVSQAGLFTGLHITWIDLEQPKGKAVIVDPTTGEVLKSKKMRGSKQGGHIELQRCVDPWCVVIGEGIETVLAVYTAMAERGRSLDGIAFWAAGDLGNLAGSAARQSQEKHPTAKDAAGRARRVPGAEPNFDSKAVTIPDGVRDLRLLADGDSDPFTTGLAMQRAQARHACAGRRITVAWPGAGVDFNKVLKPEVA